MSSQMGDVYNCALLFPVEDHFAKALGDTWLKLQAQAKDGRPAKPAKLSAV
jgi:hypothetical protein